MNPLKPVVCLAVIALAMSIPQTGFAQRRVEQSVPRAPAILFVNGPAVTASTQVTCTRVAQGPQEMAVETGSRTVAGGLVRLSNSTMQPMVMDQQDCGPLASRYEASLRQVAEYALGTVGRTVTWDPTATDLQFAVQLQPTASTSFTDQRSDSENDQTCANMCGDPVCRNYSIEYTIQEVVSVTGPLGPSGQPQTFTGHFPNSFYSTGFVACNDNQASGYFREVPAQVMVAGENQMISEIGLWLSRQLGTWSEQYSARRNNIRRSDGASDAADIFDRGDYARAGEAYLAAFDAERDDLNTGKQVDMLFNAALAFLAAGQLERGLEAANRAAAIDSTRDVRNVTEELQRRVADRETFAAIGVESPI